MGVNGGVFAFQLDGLFRVSDGSKRSMKDIALGAAVDVAFSLLQFHQLRLALKIIEQEDAGIIGKAQAGRDLGEMRLGRFAVGVSFLVECRGFGDGGSSAVLLVFLRRRPIYQRGREFFPFVAFGALVAHAIAFDFILGDQLVGAVLENEAAGEILGRARVGRKQE